MLPHGDNTNTMDASSWQPPAHWKFTGFRHRTSSSSSSSSPSSSTTGRDTKSRSELYQASDYLDDVGSSRRMDGALMPDGGLSPCVIKVIGVGGGGSNAVDRMLDTAVGGVDFWALNTDAQALGRSKAKGAKVLNIGASVTRGLGAGGNPDIGRMAAEESRKEITEVVAGTDLCFVTSGMGGGTGSGAAPVVAEVAKESGCLTVGIVTKPFVFEGKRRMKQAVEAIERLRQNVDTVIVVSNDRLLEIIPDDTPMERAFAVADDILRQGVVGISDIIVKPGLINVDFADVRAIMNNAGTALMGIGIGAGKTAATDAAAAAISSPLLDSTIDNAKGVVFNISGGPRLSLNEVNQAAKLIYSTVEADANVIFGALVDETLGDSISITVLATGFSEKGSSNEMRAGIENARAAAAKASSYKNDIRSTAVRRSSPATAQPQTTTATKTSSASTPTQREDKSDPSPPPRRTNRDGDGGGGKVPSFLRNLKRR
ncbi:hypothetical protein ACA910_012653 [Epithemia clementina (nom. ined.)]